MSANTLTNQQRRTAGDTIVEVLVAITIVSAVLAGAFVSANRSFNTTRNSQERGEALKVAEKQAELLKKAEKLSPPVDIHGGGTNFCMNDTPTISRNNSPPCVSSSIPGGYRATVTRSGSDFNILVVWDRIGNVGGTNQLQIDYRIFP